MQGFHCIGRLTDNPVVKKGDKGSAVFFRVAVDRSKKELDENGKRISDFFNVVMFNESGVYAGENLKKAQRVYLEGEIHKRLKTNKEGKEYWDTEIVARRFEFIERKGSWRDEDDEEVEIVDDVGMEESEEEK